jgi:hypothetical protein
VYLFCAVHWLNILLFHALDSVVFFTSVFVNNWKVYDMPFFY